MKYKETLTEPDKAIIIARSFNEAYNDKSIEINSNYGDAYNYKV